MDVITKNVSVQGGNRLLKLSLKQGEYLNIGDNIRVVYAGGAGNHIRLLVDAPRDVNIARNKTETNPERRKDTYYAEPGISREAQADASSFPIYSLIFPSLAEYIPSPKRLI